MRDRLGCFADAAVGGGELEFLIVVNQFTFSMIGHDIAVSHERSSPLSAVDDGDFAGLHHLGDGRPGAGQKSCGFGRRQQFFRVILWHET